MNQQSIAMPFSGGQDSIMNLILQIRAEPVPVHLFYFRMGTPVSLVEEDGIKSIVPRIKDILNFKDVRLHFVDAFNLKGLSQEPNPFVPFRNYFFGQYLLGLGFSRILFSFSGEDSLFYDTSNEFMQELQYMGLKNLNRNSHVFTHTRNMGRIDYMRFVCDQYGYDSLLYSLMTTAHSCSSARVCNSCSCCLLTDIATMWAMEKYKHKHLRGWTKVFINRWKGHTTFRDFYKRVMAGDFCDTVVRDQYWKFVEEFGNGTLLKGLAL